MVFLIFTRANLYLGINGRITELLPFGESAYLSLAGYSFPDDMVKVLEIVHEEVEAYFDRTAFGMPSNIGLLVVFSEGVDHAIKHEIHNEFSQTLPAGWIWENGLLDQTDHLDSASEEELPISFRRLIKSLKTSAGINKQLEWNMGNSVNVQMLEQLTVAPHRPSPLNMLKEALPSDKYFSAFPRMLKRIDVMAFMVSTRRKLARMVPTMPSLSMPSLPAIPKLPALPAMPVMPQRKYLMLIPAVIIVVALGALVWPDGDGDKQRINKDQDLITSTSQGPLNPPSTQMVNNVDSNKVDSSNLAATDTINTALIDSIKLAKQLADASNIETTKNQTSGSSGLISSNDRVNKNNEGNRSAKQLSEKSAVKEPNDTLSKPIATDNPEISSPIGIKTSNTDSSEEKSSSSLPLSEYAQHSQAARFPGGEGGMIRYIALNSQYPKLAKRKKITGTVVVKFDVDVEGRIVNTTIVKSLGYGCDEEAIRVVRNMPLWKPATQLRKRISSTHTVSVPFN